VPLRIAPPGIAPVVAGAAIAGCALPARHYGSVDVFLKACGAATTGDVLVVDNEGRTDEACVGDLTVLEAQASGIGGTRRLGSAPRQTRAERDRPPALQLWNLPCRTAATRSAEARSPLERTLGEHVITRDDIVFADDDAAVFVPADRVDELLDAARAIWHLEREQASRITAGETLRTQTSFDEYLTRRANDPSYTFRQNLRQIGGAIEE
jgi:4-hydroxy-4-methyl-2-oxoglutarate aldolase